MISSILMMFAFVFFVFGTTNWIPESSKITVVSAGLACWTLSLLLVGWK